MVERQTVAIVELSEPLKLSGSSLSDIPHNRPFRQRLVVGWDHLRPESISAQIIVAATDAFVGIQVGSELDFRFVFFLLP